jgi:hypothetical protein
MINLAKGAIVMAAVATVVTLAGCSSAASPATQQKKVLDIGRRPGGNLAGSPDAVVVPAEFPRGPVAGSRAVCDHIPELTQLAVARENGLPQDHITFTFPARVFVTSAASARAVATVLCDLPRDTIVNCPADFGVSYWLYFSPARLHLAPVEADPAGCEDISGLGVPSRWALPQFWQALGAAMHLLRPGENQAAIRTLFAGQLPGA